MNIINIFQCFFFRLKILTTPNAFLLVEKKGNDVIYYDNSLISWKCDALFPQFNFAKFNCASKSTSIPASARWRRFSDSVRSKYPPWCPAPILSAYVAPGFFWMLVNDLQLVWLSPQTERTKPNCENLTELNSFLAGNQMIKRVRIAAIATSTFKYHGNVTPLVDLP